MTRCVVLLRAVNIGGNSKIAMADLKTLAGDLGFADPVTLLQSGNLVCEDGGRSAEEIERAFEEGLDKRLGVKTDVMVRSAVDWSAILTANPFTEEAKRDPSHLLLMPLKREPAAGALEKLRAAIKGPERVEIRGRTAFLVYPAGIGRSKLTTALIERHLGTRGTGRNWNTALKLAGLAG